MGILHGKDRSTKSQDLHSMGSFKSNHSDGNLFDINDRSFVVVWCDASIGSLTNSNDDTNTLMQLARIVNKKRQLIHTFNEISPCRNFIKDVNNICLIVSGSMGLELVPDIHDLVQVHSIYIFCLYKEKYDIWAKQYNKVRGVFTDINEICEYLKRYFISQPSSDYELLQFDLLPKEITLPTPDKRELSFIYPILSKIILCNMQSIRQENMINYCRIEYTNDYQIHLINEFETNYSQHNPIWWFTRDNFFQGIINRALQIHDLYTLCMMDPFIKDLTKKLAELYKHQIRSLPQTLYLYSSQSISIEDFDKLRLNNGGLMCINQFLFANTEQAIALMFIEHENSTSTNTNYVNVMFKISISRTIQPNASYASIGTASEFVHEKEYLISMSSIFRIEKIERLADVSSAWSVHITFIDKNDSQLINLAQLMGRDRLYENSDLSELGSNITNKLYQFKSIRKLFEQELNYKPKQIRPILLHYNMGIIYECLNDYGSALEEYGYAKMLTRKCLPNGQQKDNLCLVPFYSNIGLTYQQMNIFNHAFDHAFRTLSILSEDHEDSILKKEFSASSHFNLGLILEQQGKISEAIPHYEKALTDRQEYLPIDHPDVVGLHDIIASLSSEEISL